MSNKPSDNGTKWHLVEEAIRRDEREKVLSLAINHTVYEVLKIVAKLNQLKGNHD